MNAAQPPPWRRILRIAAGWALLVVGLIVSIPVIVPGWGLPFLVAGLGLLAPEYEWARKLHLKARGLYQKIIAKIKSRGH